jgi:exo-beta-1,3-glucanase (GH17 family)
MPSRRDILLTLAGMAAAAPTGALASQAPQPLSAACHGGKADLFPLREAMAKGRFIAYHPTAISFWYGKPTRASEASIEADLKALRPWFDGLITYSSTNGAEHVVDVAAKLGYRAVIQGVWDPVDLHEVENAVAAYKRHPKLVAGLSLGNEVVLSKRGTWGDLAYGMGRVRRLAPELPITATETFSEFLDDPDSHSTLSAMDFMMVNVHPIFQTWFRQAQPFNWAQFVVRVTDLLSKAYCGPIIIKETGVPTGPVSAGFTSAMQRDFYRQLEAQMPPSAARAFAYFSAFDLPWHAFDSSPTGGNDHPEEAYWGFFTEARAPKPIIGDLRRLGDRRL